MTTVVKFGKLEKSNRVATRQKEFSMSNFWSSIRASAEVEPVVEQKSGFWESLGISSKVEEPVEDIVVKPSVKESKAVQKAEQVYETIEGLVLATEDCIHHWIIPNNVDNPKWTIGSCKKCNGEKWFNNQFSEKSEKFNDTLIHPTGTGFTDSITNNDVRDITQNYNAEKNSAEEGE